MAGQNWGPQAEGLISTCLSSTKYQQLRIIWTIAKTILS